MGKKEKEELKKIAELKWECLRRNNDYREFWEDYQKNPDKYNNTKVYNPPKRDGESKGEWIKRVGRGNSQTLLNKICKEFEIMLPRDPNVNQESMTEGRIFMNPCVLSGDPIVFQIPNETINEVLNQKYDDNIIILGINLLKKQKYIEQSVKSYINTGLCDLGLVDKRDFKDKILLKRLHDEKIIKNYENYSNYVYFEKTIKNKDILRKRLEQIGVSEIEPISAIWRQSFIGKINPSKSHIKKIPNYLKIWDLKKEGKNFETIVQEVYEKEWNEILLKQAQNYLLVSKKDFGDNDLFQRLCSEKIIEMDSNFSCRFHFADYIGSEEQLEKRLNSTNFPKNEQKLVLNIWRQSMNPDDSDDIYDENNKMIQRVKDECEVAEKLITGGYKDLETILKSF